MPKIVNHDAQREKFAEATMRLVARQGLEGVTMRAYVNRYSGLKALEHLLCDDAIINESSRDDWIVWLTFLYKAALQATFADTYAELIDGWQARITQLLQDAQQAGEIRRELDIDFEAIAIWAYSAGISQLSLLHPELLPVKLQKQLISAYLDKLRAD